MYNLKAFQTTSHKSFIEYLHAQKYYFTKKNTKWNILQIFTTSYTPKKKPSTQLPLLTLTTLCRSPLKLTECEIAASEFTPQVAQTVDLTATN